MRSSPPLWWRCWWGRPSWPRPSSSPTRCGPPIGRTAARAADPNLAHRQIGRDDARRPFQRGGPSMPKAAVLTALNEPLEILDVGLESPHAGELRIRLGASGVCHSDMSVQNGTLMGSFPMVLGHEG